MYLLQLVRRLLARAVKREQREFHFPSRAEELGARTGTSQPASHAAGHRDGDMELLCVTVNTVSCQDSSRDEDAGDAASGHLLLCLKLIFVPL